ncbi:MAG: hypothetical protein M1319_01400 [Chloroflexi bacterium]|nr:hypothetical protein [Chloroflexota bacterium]
MQRNTLLALFSVLLVAILLAQFNPSPPIAQAAARQWQWQNPLPQGNNLNSVYALDETHVWAVGDNGALVHRDGSQWIVEDSHVAANLRSVSALDSQHVWAVGQNGCLLFYDGTSWQTISSDSSPGDIRAMAALDSRHVWAAGAEGIYFFDGSTWVKQASMSVHALAAVDPSHAWCICRSTDRPNDDAFWAWDGHQWALTFISAD